MALLNLGPASSSSQSFVHKAKCVSLIRGTALRTTSFTTILPGTGSYLMQPEGPVDSQCSANATVYMQYPIGSVLRTADEIALLLQATIPSIKSFSARMVADPYTGPWPMILVTPAEQHVHQVFSGLSGNPNGHFNRYSIRYLGLPVYREQEGTEVRQAEDKFWYTLELILRAFKKDPQGNLGGAVIRVADEMDIRYAEMGPYINWKESMYIGGVLLVSVFERYRLYGE